MKECRVGESVTGGLTCESSPPVRRALLDPKHHVSLFPFFGFLDQAGVGGPGYARSSGDQLRIV